MIELKKNQLLLSSLFFLLINVNVTCQLTPCMSGNVGGTVFNDLNANGVIDSNTENGEPNISVSLYACTESGSSQFIEEVFTDANGEYQFVTTHLLDLKIVFGDLLEGYSYSSNGLDNGSDVQFIKEVGCNYNLGLYHIDDVCASSDLELSVAPGELFSNGKLLGPGIAMITCGTILDLPQDDRHTVGLVDIRTVNTADNRPEVNPGGWYHPSWHVDEIGNVYGIDYDKEGNIYVTASSHYSHIFGYILGSNTSNYTQAIIKYGDLGGGSNSTDAAGTIYKLDGVTGQASVFAQLPQQEFGFSHYACEANDPPLSRTTGPGLGNISYDETNNQFFASNFEDGKIYRLDINGNVLSSFDPQTLDVFSADDGQAGWASDAKPYGLSVAANGTTLYFGTHELNMDPGLYSIDLNESGDFTGTEIFHRIFQGEGDLGFQYAADPSWIAISDLEFLPDGRLSIGLRTGCAGEYATSHNHGATFYIVEANDPDGLFDDNIINPDIQYPNDATGNDDGYGGIGIWDKKDGTYDFLISSSDTRNEEGPHGMILFPHNFTNGNSGFSLQPSAAIPYLPSFNVNDFKGVGGDVEVFSPCGEAPIHLGNLVWLDSNGNGIQDPCEDPIAGLSVKLYSKPLNGDVELVASTTTNALGQYYFKDNTSLSENWESGYSSVEFDEDYAIVFCGNSYDETSGALSFNGLQFIATIPHSQDAILGQDDSDLEEFNLSGIGVVPAICFTADKTNFTYDAGFVQMPGIIISDTDITCGPVEEGGTLLVNIEGGIPPYSYDWSEELYDNQSSIHNVPVGIYSVTITDALGSMTSTSSEISIESCPPNPCINGELGGSVFNDQNVNGLHENSEISFQGIKVQLFVCNEMDNNTLVETVFTDPNGDYHFTNSNISFEGEVIYQIVFSNLPENYISSSLGMDNSTDVQYVSQFGCDYDYGILHPDLACAMPNLEESVIVGDELFSSGTLLGPGIALVTCGTIIDLPNDERHTVGLVDIKGINTDANRPEVNPNGWYHPSWNVDNIGNVFGIDYDTQGNIYVTASSHYSHIYGYVLGSNVSNYTQAIIKYGDLGGGTDDLGAAGTVYKLDAATGEASVFVQLPQQAFSFNHYACEAGDPPLSRVTGPGLGNIVFDAINNQFFVSNFEDGKIYRIDPQGNIINSFDPQTLSVFSAFDGSEGWASDAKPYGLAVNKEGTELFFGTHELNTNPGLYSVDLVDGNFSGVEKFHRTYLAEGDIGFLYAAEPGWLAISDLEFLPNGMLMIGSRTGCAGEYATSHNHGATFYIADQQGDGIYDDIISNPDIQYPNDATNNDDGYGGIGIWDKKDGTYDFLVSSSDTRSEEGPHGMILFPHNFTNGNSGFPLQPSAAIPYLPSFNVNDFKGIGGDVEVFSPCGEIPIHVGNYAWIDSNGNGIQEACESPMTDITVKLYTKPTFGQAQLVATTNTNAMGEYYFSDSTNINEVWEFDFAKIEKDSSYYIVFCGESYDPITGLFTSNGLLFSLSSDNVDMTLGGDLVDSEITNISIPDVGEFPGICITADKPNYTFDTGFVPKPDVALTMVVDPVFDLSGIGFGDAVKFKIVVYNQSLASIDSVSIIDYLPAGYTYDETIIGNEYWSVDGSGNPIATISQRIASGEADSICIYLQVQPSDDVTDWINVAEISAAYQSGVSIEDCDSPLNTNPLDNVGSEINTEADNEIGGDGSATNSDGVASTDQDNVDPAAIDVCDLALINIVEELPVNPSLGDTVKYSIIIENQGNVSASNITIQYTIPDGLIYLMINNDDGTLEPDWVADTQGAYLTISDELLAGEVDTVCIYLEIDNLTLTESNIDAYTTYAEISSFEDPNDPGIDKSDFDSTPNSDESDDLGGNPDDATDNETGGTGEGTGDPSDDTNPDLDEDDHDSAIIYLCDAATIIYTDEIGPFEYGDIVKFNVVVYNQGNDSITNIVVNDNLGKGLGFVSTSINSTENWVGNDNQVSVIFSDVIAPGQSDTICLELEILQVEMTVDSDYLQIVEIQSIEDSNDISLSKTDIDSTPDLITNNDSGGNTYDATDNAIDGDGSGNPDIELEDTDPTLDEDDSDPVVVAVFDLAFDIMVNGSEENYIPGDTVLFDLTIYNQGNVPASNFTITDYVKSGFAFIPGTFNMGWNPVGNAVEYDYSSMLNPGDQVTIQLSLQVVIPSNPLGLSDWWNCAEISASDDDGISNTAPPLDADSTPDSDNTNDNDVIPNTDEDNEINENGKLGEDEDDHDIAEVVVGYDLALEMIVEEGPYSYGDTLDYTITVTNQGGLTATGIEIFDTIACGLIYDPLLNPDWNLMDGKYFTTIPGPITTSQSETLTLKLILDQCDIASITNYYSIAEISNFLDANGMEPSTDDTDSTPDANPLNDMDEEDSLVDGNPLGESQEDDHDFEDLEIFDLALKNVIVESNDPPFSGDTIKYEVVIFNQGNKGVNSVTVNYLIPIGLKYLPINNTLDPVWTEESISELMVFFDEVLEPGDSVVACIYLQLEDLETDEATVDSWTTIAEISEYTDQSDEMKTEDIDSHPDDDFTNDVGGNPNDATNDIIDGSGEGNPDSFTENSDPYLDEDDHDSEIVNVCDVAISLETGNLENYKYKDVIKYLVVVHNQGNGDITNVNIKDVYGEGLKYINAPINTNLGWTFIGDGELNQMVTNVIKPGERDTTCLYMELFPDFESSEESWKKTVEIVVFESPENVGVPLKDVDNSPTSPPMQKDSEDTKDIDIYDLALINTIVELEGTSKLGDTIKYEVIVKNQGNVIANSIDIDYLLPNGLVYLPLNNNLDLAWIEESNTLLSITSNELAPGESDTLCLYLQLENVPSGEVANDSWTTISEITKYIDENGDLKIEDIDSKPDDDLTNDVGGNPQDGTNDQLEGDGTGDPLDPTEDTNPLLDEDDNDPALVKVCDVAAIINTDQEGPFSYGDTLKYFIEIHNQGNGGITNIDLQNLYGEGLCYVDNTENAESGWVMNSIGELRLVYDVIIPSGELDTVCLYMKLIPDFESSEESWLQNLEVVSYEDPEVPGESKEDLDSTPDDDSMNDSGGNVNDTNTDDITDGNGNGDPMDEDQNTNPLFDEDDQDVEDIEICDLALVNVIMNIPSTPSVNDTLKYEVIITNQGNNIANGVNVDYQIPEGLGYLLINDELIPSWNKVNNGLATVSTTREIAPGKSDTICFYLQIMDLPTSNAMDESWVTRAEITSYLDEEGNIKTEDVDSTPDNNPNNDSGGNYNDDTDNEIKGDGTGDPTIMIEDVDPKLDEDDQDPTNLFVCDIAVIIDTEDEGPFAYGDTIKYFVEIHNQGNGEVTNIDIQNLYGDGLIYLDNIANTASGWGLESEGKLSIFIDEILMPGEVDTICLFMEVRKDDLVDEDSWTHNIEIVSFENPANPGVPKHDVDSTPDDIPDNDSGGNADDDTDDYTSGNGTGDPANLIEDIDPLLDEDDQDIELVNIYDIALITQLNYPDSIYLFGNEIELNLIIENQGNVSLTDILITDYVPASLTNVGVVGDNSEWNFSTNLAEYTYTDILLSGEKDTVKLYMVFQLAEVLEDYINMAEISKIADLIGNNSTDNPDVVFDADSTPDNDSENDPGGEPNFPGDISGTDDTVNNEEKDEDDADPVLLGFIDLALTATPNEQQVDPGKEITFSITVINQGTIPSESIYIIEYIPISMSLSDSDWIDNGNGTAITSIDMVDEPLMYTESITKEITLVVNENTPTGSYVNYAELSKNFAPGGSEITEFDIDSEANDNPSDDAGGAPETASDNSIDGNGTNGDGLPGDENASSDEDDQDPAAFCVTPMPEIVGDFYACPAEVIVYSVVSFNPLNTYEWTVVGAVDYVDNNDGTIAVTYPELEGAVIDISVLETTEFDFCFGNDMKLGQVEEFLALACSNTINLSLGNDCLAVITADMILEGFSYPADSYTVTLTNQWGQEIVGNTLTLDHVGQEIQVSVEQDCFGNSCWGIITVESKTPPVITDCSCEDPSTNSACVFRCVDLDFVLQSDALTPNPTIGSCNDFDVFFVDQLISEVCGETRVVRTWTAANEWGVSTCVQEFLFEQIQISELTLPDNVTDLACGSGTTPEDIAAMFDDPLTLDDPNTPYVENNEGYVQAYPTFLVNGHPQKVDNTICELYAIYSDQAIELCGEGCNGNVKVIRKWTIGNWCEPSETTTSYSQIVESKDEDAPIIEAEGFSVSVNPWDCLADFSMPLPTVLHDLCSDGVTYTVKGPIGVTMEAPGTGNNTTEFWSVADAPKGSNIFTYTASDCCENTASVSVIVDVYDTTPPTAIALEYIVINLTTQGDFDESGVAIGVARMFAHSVDNGSYDGCSDVKLELARESDACSIMGNTTFNADGHPDDGSPDPDAIDYDPDNGEYVKFCCADIDQVDPVTGKQFGLVPVRMRVFDDGNATGIFGDFKDKNGDGDVLDPGEYDNYNETWVTVRVEGIAIASIVCPIDVTLACDVDYTDPLLIGTATTSSLCSSETVTTEFVPQLDACGIGFVIATYRIEGISPAITCTQNITIDNPYPSFGAGNITYPENLPNSPTGIITCTDDISFDPPTWTLGVCDFIGFTEEVDTFFFAVDQTTGVPSDACFKILRQFTVIDWCVYDATDGQDGLFYGSQTIKITDKEAPLLSSCMPVIFDVDDNCVSTNTILTNTAIDGGDCSSDWLKWQVLVDVWGDGEIDYEFSSHLPSNDSNINNDSNGNGINDMYIAPTMSGEEVSVEITESMESSTSNHFVFWKVTDGCGNIVTCETTFIVEDKKAPAPYCVSLSTALMTDGSVELWAVDFNLGAYDNCTAQEDLRFTFSSTAPEDDNSFNSVLGSSAMTFTEVGEIPINIYVWDESGNVDFCTVMLTVDDNEGVGLTISGFAVTEIGGGVSNATVSLEASIAEYPLTIPTLDLGEFAFDNNPANEEYVITVGKNDNHSNGVSTLDLVLIQRHILGFTDLDSPYKVIAADINNDENVSSIDIVELRKIVLGVQEEFSENTSWRFVDAGQEFTDPMDPWPIDEQREIADLATPMSNEHFVAVKIGDVNATAQHNVSGVSTEVRSGKSMLLEIEERVVKAGELIDIEVTCADFKIVSGLQGTLEFNGLIYQTIGARALDLKSSNVGLISDNMITISWNTNTAVSTEHTLFVIQVLATKDGMLSDMISMTKRLVAAEVYASSSFGASFGNNFEIQTLELLVRRGDSKLVSNILYQNEPNPFKTMTEISFNLAEEGLATLTIMDVTGKVVYVTTIEHKMGQNTIKLDKRDLLMASGIFYYTIESDDFSQTKKMIVID